MEKLHSFVAQNRYFLCFAALLLVYFLNGFVDIMDVDAAQYAALSLEMTWSNTFPEVYLRGEDYLDKPPLLFWLSALSLKIFGHSNLAYKLPAILILLLGLYSTYRFALIWYDRRRALGASLILGTTTAYFLMTNDVRTDGMLTGFTIFSIWQMTAFLKRGKWSQLVLAGIGAGCAMMTKGPIALVILAMAIGGDLLLKRDWRSILRPEWLVFLAIVGVVLAPMCWGLYTQFDLHPEKEVYGLQGPSGLEFFFWTQSFGRITGDIYWDNDSGYFFFFHTILWDFQPWIFLFIPALVLRFATLFRQRFKPPGDTEFITTVGFVLAFGALSLSNYKLPHYIFPLFPFAAVITSDQLTTWSERSPKLFKRISVAQFVFLNLFFVVIAMSFFLFFPPAGILLPAIIAVLYFAFTISFLRSTAGIDRVLLPSTVALVAFGLAMALNFYPNLLSYQASSVAAKDLFEQERAEDLVFLPCEHMRLQHSTDFYSRRVTPITELEKVETLPSSTLVMVKQRCYDEIGGEKWEDYEIYAEYPDFRITLLNIDFAMRSTRSTTLDTVLIMEKK